MSNKIKFAVIGAGHIGKRHAEMIRREEEAELVAMVDVRSKEACEAHDFDVPFFETVEELIASGIEFDVMNVCTPNGFHAAQSIAGLTAKKHIVCEKPMGLTKDSCEKVIFKSLQVNKQVFCVMQNRYSPPSVWIKELIESGKMGEIFMVQLNCYWNRDERYYKQGGWKGTKDLDGGTLYTQFSHFVDLLYWLIGDVKQAKSLMGNFAHQGIIEFEDTGVVILEFLNGAIGTINYTVNSYKKNMEGSLTIFGEKGTVKIGGQYLNELEYQEIEGYKIENLPAGNTANNYGNYQGSMSNHDKVYENVIEVLNNNASIATNSFEALKTVEIIDKIYQSKL
jgi:UDP-N-acetyl-2-amino-2-deoxyglucuronate dehydrogenase